MQDGFQSGKVAFFKTFCSLQKNLMSGSAGREADCATAQRRNEVSVNNLFRKPLVLGSHPLPAEAVSQKFIHFQKKLMII